MIFPLSYAEGADTTDSSLGLVVASLGIIAAVGILSAIPIAIARRHRRRNREGLIALMILWAVLTAGCSMMALNARMTWGREYTRRVMSGYYDPHDLTDKPKLPWMMWTVLAIAYVGVVARTGISKPLARPEEGIEPRGFEPLDPGRQKPQA